LSFRIRLNLSCQVSWQWHMKFNQIRKDNDQYKQWKVYDCETRNCLNEWIALP
jgi:plasmid rolling circle replication initiator protein Rep